MVDVYRGSEGVLIGSARMAKEKEVKTNATSGDHGNSIKRTKRVSR
jgi:hypothetical protein